MLCQSLSSCQILVLAITINMGVPRLHFSFLESNDDRLALALHAQFDNLEGPCLAIEDRSHMSLMGQGIYAIGIELLLLQDMLVKSLMGCTILCPVL
ncbi:hypothetical protein MLD38_005883 [Melastoma candidum]|uniref:Uncharacterized protein n=1 Tax=Melastoma candidum TaxID=119954 RepID=A0ACB9RKU7_9MYRT|nr:hypothetical protein MLD38_005883 [Melastoma candidum]